mmetsp:Transcript_28402/g.60570  ORF Transcript_28402/g.60570 Transcript_28402/m.60570 type:complete len:128 (+) Transcript_28402:494-877(+)
MHIRLTKRSVSCEDFLSRNQAGHAAPSYRTVRLLDWSIPKISNYFWGLRSGPLSADFQDFPTFVSGPLEVRRSTSKQFIEHSEDGEPQDRLCPTDGSSHNSALDRTKGSKSSSAEGGGTSDSLCHLN